MRQTNLFYSIFKPVRLFVYLFYHWVDEYFTPDYGAYSARSNASVLSAYFLGGNILVLFKNHSHIGKFIFILFLVLMTYFDFFYKPKITIEDLEYEYRKTNRSTKIVLKTLLLTYLVVTIYTTISALAGM